MFLEEFASRFDGCEQILKSTKQFFPKATLKMYVYPNKYEGEDSKSARGAQYMYHDTRFKFNSSRNIERGPFQARRTRVKIEKRKWVERREAEVMDRNVRTNLRLIAGFHRSFGFP